MNFRHKFVTSKSGKTNIPKIQLDKMPKPEVESDPILRTTTRMYPRDSYKFSSPRYENDLIKSSRAQMKSQFYKDLSSRILTTRHSLNPKSKSSYRLLPLRVELPQDYFIALTSPENVSQETNKIKLDHIDSLCNTERKNLRKSKSKCRSEKKLVLRKYRQCARLAKVAYEQRLKEVIPDEFWEFRKKSQDQRKIIEENKKRRPIDFLKKDFSQIYRNEQLFKQKTKFFGGNNVFQGGPSIF